MVRSTHMELVSLNLINLAQSGQCQTYNERDAHEFF